MKRKSKRPRRLSKRQIMIRVVPALSMDEFSAVSKMMKVLQEKYPELKMEDHFFIALKAVRKRMGRPLVLKFAW